MSRGADVPRLSALLGDRAIVAVVDIDDPSNAGELARVLGDSGVDALEVTFRRPDALESLARAAEQHTLPVGAGTILSLGAADTAVAAGAQFIVSPGLDEHVVARGCDLGVPTTPGVLTPSEVQAAVRLGCPEVKLFPAGSFGGPDLLHALSTVFTGVRFMPTGGVDHDAALDYLGRPEVFAVGGTWIAPRDLVARGDWSEISRRAARIRSDVDRLA